MEMRIYVANLRKYNEGELVGAWFVPPLDEEEIAEQIGLNDQYEEYAIHDYELPFEIDEYTSIEDINYMCQMAEELLDIFGDTVIHELVSSFFSSLEELYDHRDDFLHYNCDSEEGLGEFKAEEYGYLNEIPDYLHRYFDYKAFGRDLMMDGNFIETSDGIYEYCR